MDPLQLYDLYQPGPLRSSDSMQTIQMGLFRLVWLTMNQAMERMPVKEQNQVRELTPIINRLLIEAMLTPLELVRNDYFETKVAVHPKHFVVTLLELLVGKVVALLSEVLLIHFFKD